MTIQGNFDADGVSETVVVDSDAVFYIGSEAGKSFGGGAAYLQAQGPDGNWYRTGAAIVAPTVRFITVPLATPMRVELDGATGPDLHYAIRNKLPRARVTVSP